MVLTHNWSDAQADPQMKSVVEKTISPEYLRTPAPLPDREAMTLSPSQLGGMHALPGEGDDEQAAMKRGSQIHLLLEVLPDIAPEDRAEAAERVLDTDDWLDVFEEVKDVLDAPDLTKIFAKDVLVEVPITAKLDELADARVLGRIDRLVVSDDEVLAVDFKSNRQIPVSPETTPEAILRQMGAYRAVLAQVYPGRTVKTAIVWTDRAKLMELPEKVTSDALLRAASS